MSKLTEDSRFAYLLQPIRDLAVNWDIDIAKELELYLEELEHITFSFDGGRTNLNFTEAALLIQGSTCVYSKKVEYLYNLVLRTLDQVLGKRREAIASSLDDAGKDADVAFDDDPEMLALDDRIKVSDNIDVDDTAPLTKTMSIMRTPLALLSMPDDVGETRKLTDFKVSSCAVHASGALLLEPESGSTLDAALLPVTTAAAAVTVTAAAQAGAGVGADVMQTDSFVPEPLGYGADDDDDDGAGGWGAGLDVPDNSLPLHAGTGAEVALAQGAGPRGSLARRSGPVTSRVAARADPWRMLDPHESQDKARRPYRKMQLSRADRKKGPSVDPEARFTLDSLAAFFERTLRAPATVAAMRAPLLPALADVFVPVRAARRSVPAAPDLLPEEQLADELDATAAGDYVPPAPLLYDGGAAAGGLFDAGADSDDDGGDAGGGYGGLDPLPADPHAQGTRAFPDAGAASAPATADSAFVTYEELCRQYKDRALISSKAFAAETAIAERVAEWQAKLQPMLRAQEQHAPFDIQAAGRELLAQLPTRRGAVTDFVELSRRCEPYEVCRLFAATLHLANMGNVDIVGGAAAGTVACSFGLKLLNRELRTLGDEAGAALSC